LQVVANCYSSLQRNKNRDDIFSKTSKNGLITLGLQEFMKFEGIEEEATVLQYEQFLKKDSRASSFASLIGLSFNKYPRGAKSTMNFKMAASPTEIRQMVHNDGLKYPPPLGHLCPIINESDNPSNRR
jgi:hypothetical protein